MAILSHEAAFKAVQSLVASWSVADYVHHISMLKDRVTAIDFAVVFSKPRADCPLPTTCSVLVTLTQPGIALHAGAAGGTTPEATGAGGDCRSAHSKGSCHVQPTRRHVEGTP